jgi:hypothetical protein
MFEPRDNEGMKGWAVGRARKVGALLAAVAFAGFAACGGSVSSQQAAPGPGSDAGNPETDTDGAGNDAGGAGRDAGDAQTSRNFTHSA